MKRTYEIEWADSFGKYPSITLIAETKDGRSAMCAAKPAAPSWREWDGTDIGKTVLVRTHRGDVVVAQQIKGLSPDYWVIFVPGTSMLFQPTLKEKVTHWMPLPEWKEGE